MIALLYVAAAVCAYLISGLNPAIIFSKLVYKKDIRTMGSGNPGFTNFRRTFGGPLAWLVLVLDLSKSAVAVAVFAFLFKQYVGDYSLGASFTGLFAILGHAYPVWYKFKGGKGFLAYLSCVYFIDWRAGLIATAIMVILLAITKYMSVATVVGMLTCPVTLILFKADTPTVLLCTAGVLFMTWRHKENFKRLAKGTESRFSFRSKKHV